MLRVGSDTMSTVVINTHYNTEVVQQFIPWKATGKVDAISWVLSDTMITALINTHYHTEVVQQLIPWRRRERWTLCRE